MQGDFHGRTLGSLATTWNHMYRAPYQAVLPPALFVPLGDAETVRQELGASDNVAAVILEADPEHRRHGAGTGDILPGAAGPCAMLRARC